DRIGWRNDSMRLLVFVSDGDSHFGMDSKMAGIVIPNDGQCHLDANNEYSMSTKQEYPTLGQLIDKVVENNILLIFAVTENQINNYKVNSLFCDRNLHKSVLSLNLICWYIFFPLQVVFNVSVALSGCLSGVRRFSLKPVGIQESLEVELESLCSCDCHRLPTANRQCTEGQGIYHCGVCVCQPGFLGAQCECNDETGFLSNCLATNDSEICNGQGDCYCGQCVCHPSSYGRIYGTYCECDNYSCVRFRGELCGGHGVCDCGKCHCETGWTGEYCNCSSSTEACMSENGSLCSGRGKCNCGQCICSVAGASGEKCERCPTCVDSCTYAHCVECHLLAKDDFGFCDQNCNAAKLSINTTGGCPEPPNIPMIILGVSLSVVCIGVSLLAVWKALVSVHDRKEVARFEAERAKVKWQTVRP
uniref:Integrin beta n=1 Tax=Xiphophorus couchianus TaxID=32473 RepID=A0A3B5KVQ1_9TELE